MRKIPAARTWTNSGSRVLLSLRDGCMFVRLLGYRVMPFGFFR
ncbi:hypothetical protein O6P37_24855 [Mycobacterium sp. CPCC 205372]|uniref:Uncharacterized protein n=1 Tax=Mycobacterium hippophais TaxID=3016340 RepID=A0ABT4PZT7_9MYCO|nr:hypothetical protein [Mycobacterium hippophais]MCZ8382102.1 hypothetical protein [Mycobacterium hippophais]